MADSDALSVAAFGGRDSAYPGRERERRLEPVARRASEDSRKCFYNRAIQVVAGEKISQFVRAVMAAEATSLVTNLGTRGIGYIKGDLTVGLVRLPVGEWIGVQGDSHWSADGVAVGTATLFDRAGAFGSGMITAVSNPAAQIDFAHDRFPLRIG